MCLLTKQKRVKLKIIILGNSGSGKSSLAKRLSADESVALLPLDDVAFENGAERRSVAESVIAAEQFINSNENWIIEGCYADIIEPLLTHTESLIFLNPGIETCVSHCRSRPWEPEKFASKQLQDELLNNLIEWVQQYETRDDEYGLRRHREAFEAFKGVKREFVNPADYAAL